MFENVVHYDKAAARVLVEVDSRVLRRKNFLIRRVILFAVGIFAVACGGLLLMVFGELSAFTRVICLFDLVVGLLALWKGICLRRVMVKRVLRTLTGGDRRVVFTEEEIQIEQPGVQKGTFYYSTLTALYETEAHFVLPLSTKASMVLDKGGFVQGSVAEFRNFIQEKTGRTMQFVNWK